MTAKVVRAHSRGLVAVELFGTVFRACSCGEPNPSYVECPRCGTLNSSGHPCRSCGGAVAPEKPWTVCPACGRSARIEDRGLLTAWYANPLKQLGQMFREWRRKRQSQKGRP